MEPEPDQDNNIDKVLEGVDWEKLGIEGVEDEAVSSLAAQAGPEPVAKVGPSAMPKTGPSHPAVLEPSPPAGVQLIHRGADIEIVRRWFGQQTVVETAFVVFLGFIVFLLYSAVDGIRITEESLYLLFFAAAGIYLAYRTLAGWLNRTHIVVSPDKITVRHEPVPWPGNKEIEVSNVQHVRTGEQIHESRTRLGFVTGTTRTYDVHALTHWDQSVELVTGLRELEQAFFIAVQIERYLGL